MEATETLGRRMVRVGRGRRSGAFDDQPLTAAMLDRSIDQEF
jgi:hypothetical protein